MHEVSIAAAPLNGLGEGSIPPGAWYRSSSWIYVPRAPACWAAGPGVSDGFRQIRSPATNLFRWPPTGARSGPAVWV